MFFLYRFSDLTQEEQAALVEIEYQHIIETPNEKFRNVCDLLNSSVDNHLIDYLVDLNFSGSQTKSNLDTLTDVSSVAVVQMLRTLPAEYLFGTKLFLNRQIPTSLRPHFWTSALQVTPVQKNSYAYSRLAPTLDVLLARKSHDTLERDFPEFSSRTNASFLKTTIANLFRKINLRISEDHESLRAIDRCVCIAVPLIIILQSADLSSSMSPQGNHNTQLHLCKRI